MGIYRVIVGGRENMRPSNLRHNLGRLEEDVRTIKITHPNTSGTINMSDESGPLRFTPS